MDTIHDEYETTLEEIEVLNRSLEGCTDPYQFKLRLVKMDMLMDRLQELAEQLV